MSRDGITVNAICPGPISTPPVQGMPKACRGANPGEFAIGRFGEVTEVAPAVVMLASDDGASYSGATMNVNGGDHMI